MEAAFMHKKTYVLDTNVLLHNPDALFSFEENDVVIPLTVIEEIDNQKKRQDEIGRNARVVSRMLDGLRKGKSLSEGVDLPTGGKLTIELNHSGAIEFPPGLDPEKYDNRILAVAYNLGNIAKENEDEVVLVSKDLNLRIKADVLGVSAEDFLNDKVDYTELYQGARKITISSKEFEYLKKKGSVVKCEDINGFSSEMLPHEFVVFVNESNPADFQEFRHENGKFVPLRYAAATLWGARALNREQRFAVELLMDDDVKVVSLISRAGTGKTLLSLAAGLEKVLEENVYTRLLITRPVVPMGDEIGFLPGTKEEKMRPWMQPIYDNLEFLFRNCPEPYEVLQDLIRKGTLELEPLTYIRGRSIPKQFIICDEAQNLSPHMIKTLITRVGEDTKIVLTGDPEQIDNPYLDASSNGLTYLVERLKGEGVSGHVTLLKGERSRVAELGGRLL